MEPTKSSEVMFKFFEANTIDDLESKIRDWSEQITDKAGWPLLDADYTVAMSPDQHGKPHALYSIMLVYRVREG